ncbi:hypothetical protein EVAR_8783_1 [Eumeta japonica]|uniref:Uncharacterized protein n=1 Tax=Eumeta variegata TaxID=151549 RepID=A0A4C1TU42_EUMVA|nr:hypothetical protein EVAR_8783_1 [Eumeta japonica]
MKPASVFGCRDGVSDYLRSVTVHSYSHPTWFVLVFNMMMVVMLAVMSVATSDSRRPTRPARGFGTGDDVPDHTTSNANIQCSMKALGSRPHAPDAAGSDVCMYRRRW